MAKSKNGGTRAYIRGRIGSDVYSIGKDGKGSRQQVVRSLAEQVSNPRSQSQMFGRMIMSTVMQAVSNLSYIIDHSFDGVAKGQPSISEFIRRNYALVKADAQTHPSAGNAFGLNAYQEKGVKKGAYVVSDGKALMPSSITLNAATGVVTLATSAASLTVDALREALGFGNEDYVTLVGINAEGSADFCRLSVNPKADGAVVITAENVGEIVLMDGNVDAVLAVAGINITATIASIAGNCGIILTKKENGGFIHSSCVLSAPTNPSYNATTAIMSYPLGAQMYLNGGDLNGGGGSAVVDTPMSFKLGGSGATGNVDIVGIQQAENICYLLDAEGHKYGLQNEDDDTVLFGKFLINSTGTKTTDWANDIDDIPHDGQVQLEDYADGSSQNAKGISQVNWLIAHGCNFWVFFTSSN